VELGSGQARLALDHPRKGRVGADRGLGAQWRLGSDYDAGWGDGAHADRGWAEDWGHRNHVLREYPWGDGDP
jgi:hypothetical protein